MRRRIQPAAICLFVLCGWAALLPVQAGTTPAVLRAAQDAGASVPLREPWMLVEIPAGGSIKYEWSESDGRIVVDRFLSMPVVFPANYGHVRESLAGDGDPLDVLVYTREPVQPGALIRVRPIGVLRMTDRGEEDDKLIAVPASSVDPLYDGIRDVTELSLMERRRLEAFFVVYKLLPEGGNPVQLGALEGFEAAQRTLEDALLRYRQSAAP